MWYVFDINETTGYAFKTRIKLFAIIVSHLMGDNYDYGDEQEMRGY